MVLHPAECIDSTGVCHRARVEAFPVDAGIVQRTLGVVPTFRSEHGDKVGRDLETLDSRVASITNRT
jgi:hypothetical protein